MLAELVDHVIGVAPDRDRITAPPAGSRNVDRCPGYAHDKVAPQTSGPSRPAA